MKGKFTCKNFDDNHVNNTCSYKYSPCHQNLCLRIEIALHFTVLELYIINSKIVPDSIPC